MATSASYRHSPDEGRDPSLPGSVGDEESWAFMNLSDASNTESLGILTSPESSLISFGVSMGQQGHLPPSPLGPPSPFDLNAEQVRLSHQSMGMSLPRQGSSYGTVNLERVTSHPMGFETNPETASAFSLGPEQLSNTSISGSFSDQSSTFGVGADHPDGLLFSPDMQQPMSSTSLPVSSSFAFDPLQLPDFSFPLSNDLGSGGMPDLTQPLNAAHLDFLQQFQAVDTAAPWQPSNLGQGDMFIQEDNFTASSSPVQYSSTSSQQSTSPGISNIKLETDSSKSASPTDPVRKVRGSGSRVEKKRKASSESSSSAAAAAGYGQFVIVTPNSINANSGKHNPFECFEAMRSSHKGRKGPLPSKTKENALQVRRKGACFCCHARKVKCDAERPCRNCTKLAVGVPQVVCWQFPDFIDVLFPTLIRGHLGKEAVTSFLSENVKSFTVQGTEMPCSIELFSGLRFTSVFKIKAKFFTAKTQEPLEHWHMSIGSGGVNLQSQAAVPIGLETESAAQKDILKKTTKDYVHAIIQESRYAEQTTDSLRSTRLPEKVLRIAQRYFKQTDSPMVKRALSIYAMHYILTRHMCLTAQTVRSLEHTGLVPQNLPFLTPRVLNRQIKAVIDDMLAREMQLLFDAFSKSLKPKSKKEWAQCLASFLVLCVFMEAIEAAVDTFVISQNEVDMRKGAVTTYRRSEALHLNESIEKMPFKQFAFQFHQIYQTHSRDATTRAFNPLLDDDVMTSDDLDQPAKEMVAALQELMTGENWSELDYLSMDPILPNMEDYPFPRDITENYNGRLLAKFLLSFTNERYIFG